MPAADATTMRSAAGKAVTIAGYNDALRRSFSNGRVVITRGVASLPEDEQAAVFAMVRGFDAFTEGNDPYGEHDFGAVVHDGTTYFWKIDSYDHDLAAASPDPADETVTTRVLTIMRADEY